MGWGISGDIQIRLVFCGSCFNQDFYSKIGSVVRMIGANPHRFGTFERHDGIPAT
jgi:hypothetical protein